MKKYFKKLFLITSILLLTFSFNGVFASITANNKTRLNNVLNELKTCDKSTKMQTLLIGLKTKYSGSSSIQEMIVYLNSKINSKRTSLKCVTDNTTTDTETITHSTGAIIDGDKYTQTDINNAIIKIITDTGSGKVTELVKTEIIVGIILLEGEPYNEKLVRQKVFNFDTTNDKGYKLGMSLGEIDYRISIYSPSNVITNTTTSTGTTTTYPEYDRRNYVLSKNDPKCGSGNVNGLSTSVYSDHNRLTLDERFNGSVSKGCDKYTQCSFKKYFDYYENMDSWMGMSTNKIDWIGIGYYISDKDGTYNNGKLRHRLRGRFSFFVPPYSKENYSVVSNSKESVADSWCNIIIHYWHSNPTKPSGFTSGQFSASSYATYKPDILEAIKKGETYLYVEGTGHSELRNATEPGWRYGDAYFDTTDKGCSDELDQISEFYFFQGVKFWTYKDEVTGERITAAKGYENFKKTDNYKNYINWYDGMKWESNGDPAYDCKYEF